MTLPRPVFSGPTAHTLKPDNEPSDSPAALHVEQLLATAATTTTGVDYDADFETSEPPRLLAAALRYGRPDQEKYEPIESEPV